MAKAMSVHNLLATSRCGRITRSSTRFCIGTTISSHNISADEKRRFRILHTFNFNINLILSITKILIFYLWRFLFPNYCLGILFIR